MEMRVIFIIGVLLTLLSMVSAIPGTATFYTNYVPSACYGSQDHGVWVAAASDPLWQNGAICGKEFTVNCTGPINKPRASPVCTGKSVTVTVVDHCPGCRGTLDLSREAFATIANPVAGVIKIDYH